VGAATMSGNLIHMMFVELIRAHLTREPDGGSGWLSALADPRVGKALRLMHDAPLHDWTLRELAERSAMSRSSFAHYFRTHVGIPPIDYLLRWRMQLARRDLVRSGHPVAKVAMTYGYASESAFGNAYKRVFGTSPRRSVREASYRRERNDRPVFLQPSSVA
jgi:transcriptional regulator GlxA family with amidase domain